MQTLGDEKVHVLDATAMEKRQMTAATSTLCTANPSSRAILNAWTAGGPVDGREVKGAASARAPSARRAPLCEPEKAGEGRTGCGLTGLPIGALY